MNTILIALGKAVRAASCDMVRCFLNSYRLWVLFFLVTVSFLGVRKEIQLKARLDRSILTLKSLQFYSFVLLL